MSCNRRNPSGGAQLFRIGPRIQKLIASETRTKGILRARLGSEDSGRDFSPQLDAIAACFKFVSLPDLTMLGHIEFLDVSASFRLSDVPSQNTIS
jgi:hypothetical protein